MNKKKVVFLTKYSYPYIGGVESHVFNLAKQMVILDYDVCIVSINDKVGRDNCEVINGIKIIKYRPIFEKISIFELFTLLDGGISLRVFSILKKIKPDIIHVHKSTDTFLLIVGLLCRFFKIAKKVVYTPHYHVKKRYVFCMIINRFLINMFDRVYAVTHIEKNILIDEFKMSKDKIIVYYNAVSKDYFDLQYNDENYILYVASNNVESKGLSAFIKAVCICIQQDSSIRVKIVGKSSDGIKFKNLVPLQSKANIEFYGAVADEQLKKIFSECSFFVLPSKYEAFGIVFLEAMACGKAVVGTNVGGIPEVIRNGIDGILIELNNQKKLIHAIKLLWTDKKLRIDMGQNGRKKVIEQFTWDRSAYKLNEDYINLFKEK